MRHHVMRLMIALVFVLSSGIPFRLALSAQGATPDPAPFSDLRQIKKGSDQGKWEIEIYGFDYYNPRTGNIESGDTANIAMWLLDPDYDGRSLFPRQMFFPMAGDKEGWAKLARNLKAEIDEDLIEAYRGTVSLPFDLGIHRRAAVKIIDDRGLESLRVIHVKK